MSTYNMKPEAYIARNINVLVDHVRDGGTISVSFIQRICRIGYNQGHAVLQELARKGFVKVDASGYRYTWVANFGDRRDWRGRYQYESNCLCLTEGRLAPAPSTMTDAEAVQYYKEKCLCGRAAGGDR